MKHLFLLFIFCPFLSAAQSPSLELDKKFHPRNCIALSDSQFIGQTEITNRMYREFVQFVKDSMFTHLMYDSVSFTRAKWFLNAPEKTIKKLTVDNRQEYAKIYGLNYERSRLFRDDPEFITVTASMYYPDHDRFYHRREIDSRKLKYTMPSGELIAVFPDTVSWVKDYYVKYSKNDSVSLYVIHMTELTSMYFWHPAYDNYPVVGLNQPQILAYCHWYARQLNENAKDLSLHYSVSLPTVNDYTEAMKLCVPPVVEHKIGPEHLINPIVYTRSEKQSSHHIHKVYSDLDPSIGRELPSDFVMREWVKTNSTSPILNLLGGPAEVVQNPKEPDYTTVLGGDYYLGLVDPNGIQANTLFYQRLLYKDQGYSFVSFRVLVKVTRP